MNGKNRDWTEKRNDSLLHILETTPVGFIVVDARWIILSCSHSATFPATPGKNLLACFPGRENLKLFVEFQKAFHQPIHFEQYYEPLKLWIEISACSNENTLSIYFKDITVQKELERKYQEAQSRLDIILDLSSEIIWEFDPCTRKATWHGNKFAKLLDHDDEDHDPVENWEKNVHPDDIAGVKANFGAAIQNGEVHYTNHYRVRKKNGEYISVRDRGHIVRNDQGEPVKVIGVTDDVTVQKRYEETLIQAEASYHSFFDKTPHPKWLYDLQTLRFLDVNEAAVKHYGYSREEFLQMTLLDIRPGEDHSKVVDCIKKRAAHNGVWTHIKKNGEKILVEVSATMSEFQNKAVHLATINDITQRNKAELALKESEQKLSNILESIGDGLLVVDRNWRITYLNGKAEKLLGRNKGYFLNRHLWEVFNDAVTLNSYPEYHKALKKNIPVRFEDYYPALNAWFEINAYPTDEGLSIYFNNITEQKQQEEEKKKNAEKLRQAEENLHLALESMTDGFYTVDKNWNIKYATDKAASLWGLNKGAYTGKNLWELFPEMGTTQFYSEYHRAFAEGKPVCFEEYLTLFNMWFEVNAYPYKDILAVYIKDISQRKNDEKRLEFIARATSEVIWEMDVATHETAINKERFNAVFGYQLPDDCNHYSFWLKNIHPEDAARVIEKNRMALDRGLDYHMNEYRFKKSDESWAYVKDRVYVVRNTENLPVRFIGAMEDVTKEREAEQALMESEQTYKQLFDNASLPKAVYDRKTLQILNVNQAAIEHYGYSREEFLNMTILDVRPPEDHAKIKAAISKLPLCGRMNLGVWTHIKKGGQIIQVEASGATIIYKGKVCNLTTVQDVTEKLKLQEQLTKEKVEKQKSITRATLQAQERERSEIGRELHDGINQVLTTAKLYVENIKYFPEQKDAFVDKSVSLLQKSINEIRVLSKALVTPTITDIGFKDALLEMIKCYRELNLFEVNYQIKGSVEKIENEIKLTVYRIIQEQLNNIVKYAKASMVRVELSVRDQQFLVRIKDNGVGFDPEQKKSGLGLSNIKNRAELFNGTTKIESAPGRGCQVRVCFR